MKYTAYILWALSVLGILFFAYLFVSFEEPTTIEAIYYLLLCFICACFTINYLTHWCWTFDKEDPQELWIR